VPRTSRPRLSTGPSAPIRVAVDVVALTLGPRERRTRDLHAVIVRRGADPFAGRWALPGGFVAPDENLDDAARRVLADEVGAGTPSHLEQVGAYGSPGRDPRARVVTVAHLAVLPDVTGLAAGGGVAAVDLMPASGVLGRRPTRRLAFDHHRILADGVDRVRRSLECTTLAAAFVEPTFTLSQLRGVYEAAWGAPLDPGNFRRKVLATDGFVVPTGETAPPGPEGGKPAQVYRAGGAVALHPPMARPTT
jgi:8-oxo-dGTP diphosphatase